MSGIGLKRFGKRAMVACLVLALSVMMVPSVAFGTTSGYQAEVTAVTGNTEVNNNIGDLTDSTNNGLRVDAYGSNASATARAGNVDASNVGGTLGGTGVYANAAMNGTSNVTVGTVDASRAVNATAYSNGTVNVTTGALRGVVIEEAGVGRGDSGGKVSVTVNGDVKSASNCYVAATGAGSSATLTVNGSIIEDGHGYSALSVSNDSDAKVDVLVTGEVSNNGGYGMLSGGFVAANCDVAVWKVSGSYGAFNGEALAKSVNYIVKTVNEAVLSTQAVSGDEPTATERNWKVSANAAGTQGLATSHGYDVANEDQVIYIVADEGYRITAASNLDDTQTVEKDADGNYFIKVKRGGGINIQAAVEAIAGTYKVIFQNEDKTELQSSTYQYNATPEYEGSTPTKAADDEYTYTFNGWTPAIAKVTADAVYTATYEKAAKEKPTPDPDEPADDPTGDNKAETKATSSSASASAGSSMPQTGDTPPVLPAMATLLVAAGALLVARRRVD